MAIPHTATARARRPLVVLGALIALVGLTVAAYLFQPWQAFIDRTANEAVPGVTASPGMSATSDTPRSIISHGSFGSAAHDTSGQVQLMTGADGARFLRIENLDTSNGPDLRVWLSDQPANSAAAAGNGQWLDLGDLRANRGSLTYPVPAEADLARYRSVVIWCRRFSVAFGAASLVPDAAS